MAAHFVETMAAQVTTMGYMNCAGNLKKMFNLEAKNIMFVLGILLLCLPSSLQQPAQFGGRKTLVLIDSWSLRETHSIFFKTLRGKEKMFYDFGFL